MSDRQSSPFRRVTVLAVVFVGFAAFLAMLYFLSAGDTGDRDRGGIAHASAKGLNGYAGLVRLLRAESYDVTLSRTPSGFETSDLLVLAPPIYADPEEVGNILKAREYLGPTLVILPKWFANAPPPNLPSEAAAKFEDGWVQLGKPTSLAWTQELAAPYAFEQELETLEPDEEPAWSGLGSEGVLPTKTITYAKESNLHEPLITDAAGHTLAFGVIGEEGSDYYDDAHWTVFVVDPDIVNNYGMADPARARAALALVNEAGYGGDYGAITFDMTLNGFGGAENLLTLAFRPPFLAATLCLILAMLIVAWRSFLRFGPTAASDPEIAFGKKRLVSNGAGLIVRAKRFRLLAGPYTELIARRLARMLGLARHDADTLDAALAARMPDEEPYSLRAQRLRDAQSPTEILRAAKALDDLTRKLAK